MTSRELNERVGGFRENKKQVFWLEDEAYIKDLERIGFGSAVLADLKVHHTGGPHYTVTPKEKADYWLRYKARRARTHGGQAHALSHPVAPASERALPLVRRAS